MVAQAYPVRFTAVLLPCPTIHPAGLLTRRHAREVLSEHAVPLLDNAFQHVRHG